jgi:hypothetical protein
MVQVIIELPDDACASLRRSPVEVKEGDAPGGGHRWYRRGLLSQGRATEIAGISHAELIDALAARKIGVLQLDFEELRGETSVGDAPVVNASPLLSAKGEADATTFAAASASWLTKVPGPAILNRIVAWAVGGGESSVLAWESTG